MITSTSNETVKHVTMLVRSAKTRRKEGLFVVEGDRMAKEIPEDAFVKCYVSEDYRAEKDLSDIFPYEVDPVIVSSSVLRKMSDTQSPQGILCVCRQNMMKPEEYLDRHTEGDLRLLVLEGIQDPGNLGTMIRCAEGAGFDAVIADTATADVYNPKVTRATMGSLFRVPVLYTSELLKVTDMIKRMSVKVYAAHLKGTKSYRDEKYGNRIAFLIGNEGNGLSDAISGMADEMIRIPIRGKLESLNAAIAAALLMFNA